MTSYDITMAWIANWGLRNDDSTFVVLRKRVGACLITARKTGLVKDALGAPAGDYKGWVIA